MEGTGKPEYDKCVAISTQASLKKMMLPGGIALITPLIIGFGFGPEVLGGFLAGATVSGVLLGMFQNNAGGAWDNAKKSFEKGTEINGEMFYKKSEPHKASVTGDTVGDPFKDTSGPSMNILIKLMSIISLVIAPSLGALHGDGLSPIDREINSIPGREMRLIREDGSEVKNFNRKQELNVDAQNLVTALAKDGHIDILDYTLSVIKGEMYINGEKQPQSMNVRYQAYLAPFQETDLNINIYRK